MPWTKTPWPRLDWDVICDQMRGLEKGVAIGSKERAEKRLAKLKVVLDVNKIEIDQTNTDALRVLHQVGCNRMSIGVAYTELEKLANAEIEHQAAAGSNAAE